MVQRSIGLGLLFSRSGSYGAVGETMARGSLLAIGEINADPAFDFTFAPQAIDPQGRNDLYVAGSRDLLAQRGLKHVVGCYTSSSRKEVLPVFEKHDALLWYPSHYEGFETSDNIVYSGAAPNQHIVPLTHFMLAQGGRRAFMVGSNYIWAWENNRIMREILNRNGGSVIGERHVPIGETGLEELVDLILRQRPDFIFNTLIGDSAYSFFRTLRRRCRAAGIDQPRDLPVVSCSLAEPELDLIGAEACDGHLSSSVYFSTVDTAANARFVEAWTRRDPQAGRTSADAEASYIAVHLLARAIRLAQASDPAAVLAALARVDFDAPQGPIRVDAENRHCFLWPRIGRSRSDGSFDIIHESSLMVRPDPYLVWEPDGARGHGVSGQGVSGQGATGQASLRVVS